MTVAPADLETYLGAAVDTGRAQYLIDRANELCQSIVNPLPAGADSVVIDVVTRAYSNPTNVAQQQAGPFGASYGSVSGGLWLTRQNKATLRRLAGGSSAFSIDTMPRGVNCAQTLAISATSGTFVVQFNSASTTPLSFDATAGQIQSALEALGSIRAGNVSVTGNGPFAVTFINQLGTTPLPGMTVDATNLTGSASVAMTTEGVRAPGQGLAYWDFDYYNSGGSSLPFG